MTVAAARELIAALPISDAEREAVLDELMTADDLYAKAHGYRMFLQNGGKTYPPRLAIYAAFRRFKPIAKNPTMLEKAIHHPNGRIKNKSATWESHFHRQAKFESSL